MSVFVDIHVLQTLPPPRTRTAMIQVLRRQVSSEV